MWLLQGCAEGKSETKPLKTPPFPSGTGQSSPSASRALIRSGWENKKRMPPGIILKPLSNPVTGLIE
jgi:hypothetical protein